MCRHSNEAIWPVFVILALVYGLVGWIFYRLLERGF